MVYRSSHAFGNEIEVYLTDLGIRFPGVTSRIPDPDHLTHSGRVLGSNSRISDAVCGCWRTDSVGYQCVEVDSSSRGFGGIREVVAVFAGRAASQGSAGR